MITENLCQDYCILENKDSKQLNLEDYMVFSFVRYQKKTTEGQISFFLKIHKILILESLRKLNNLGLIESFNGFYYFRGGLTNE